MVSTYILPPFLALQQGEMIRNIFSTEDVNAGQIVKEFFVYDLCASPHLSPSNTSNIRWVPKLQTAGLSTDEIFTHFCR